MCVLISDPIYSQIVYEFNLVSFLLCSIHTLSKGLLFVFLLGIAVLMTSNVVCEGYCSEIEEISKF